MNIVNTQTRTAVIVEMDDGSVYVRHGMHQWDKILDDNSVEVIDDSSELETLWYLTHENFSATIDLS